MPSGGRLASTPSCWAARTSADRAGCFATGAFDPGDAGLAVVRGWELTDQPTGTEQDLLGALAVTVSAERGLPIPAARHAAGASGAIPAAPLPDGYSLPGRYVPQSAYVAGTVPF